MASRETRSRALVAAVVVAAVAVIAWLGWQAGWFGGGAETDDSRLVLSGTVEAAETRIAPLVGGTVASVAATEGVAVKEGDVLFELDAALLELQVDQAAAGVRAARAALKQAQDDDASSAEIAAAKARVDQAEAAREMARVAAGHATVTSPTDGVVTAVVTRPGESASAGRALATVTDLAELTVSVYVPETSIGLVEIGDTARVTADGTDEEFPGRVNFIASEAEFTPNQVETQDQRVKLVYEVRIALDGGEFLKPGMPVDVVIDLGD